MSQESEERGMDYARQLILRVTLLAPVARLGGELDHLQRVRGGEVSSLDQLQASLSIELCGRRNAECSL